MKNVYKKGLKVVLAAGLTLGIGTTAIGSNGYTADAAVDSNLVPVQILGINDFHGALDTPSSSPLGKIGGADYLATNLNNTEASFLTANGLTDNTAANSIRVQAGDMVGASPAVSGLLQDEPTIKVLNRMKFEIGTLGNHEFDEGLAEFKRILDGGDTTDFNEITQNYDHEASDMSIVVGNVVKKSDGTIPYGFKPYEIKNMGGVDVGFIGVVTTEIPSLVLANHIQDYNFLDEAETIAKYSAELQAKGVKAIVVLSHVPALTPGNPTNGEGSVSGAAVDMMNKVNQIAPGNSVDLVLAGHNHQYTNGKVGNTRIVQSYNNGKAYSNVTGVLNKTTKDFEAAPNAEIKYNLQDVTPDAGVRSVIDEAYALVNPVISKPIGQMDSAVMTRDTNADNESPLGNLITDGQREMAKKAGIAVDFAMTNNGGIRADLVGTAANGSYAVTWGAAQAVQPFGNILQVVELTGADIVEALNQQYDESEKYFLQVSGLTYTYTKNDAGEKRVVDVKKEDGTKLDESATYRVVINDFLFGGGDSFSAFTKGKQVDVIDPDTDTFINYIQSQTKLVTPELGRKVFKTEAEIAKEKEDAAIQAITDNTTFQSYKEKDAIFKGKTVPGATVSIHTLAVKMAKAAPIVADADGNFEVDMSSENLKEGDTFDVTVTDADGYSKVFTVAVMAADPVDNGGGEEEVPGDNNGGTTTPDPDGNNGGTTTPPVTPPATTDNGSKTPSAIVPVKDDGALPQTGDETQTGAIFGGLVLIGAAVYYLRRKAA
ncbi:5'-nucleotidase C-terminal domain-containing protein [Listeria booriae]|uniref:5'-nucleotidase C-terminal domain-containing protein n=1 Tax=Listeria booriae TaxID=1552123 RepID=UPI001628F866|nr:5'-nucleotidase C-terminal domain-containing protein [Listeria booriae]MBC1974134.1 LPXTG cell wall anchor domain-containing protein [Listeria booriae]MBC2032609.1 LPXTG cell wall anchor domain-containing protein [Listeria booriae]MBC2047284.1 LPXTG cell wall anchor domain-containing protein [Listeria booriae]